MALRLLRNHSAFTAGGGESPALQISSIYPLMAVTVTQRLRPRIVVFRLADLIEGLLLFCSNVTASFSLYASWMIERVNHPPPFSLVLLQQWRHIDAEK